MVTIVQSPNPLLNTVCEPCDLHDKSLKKLAKQMIKTMYKNDGCGLAAPQLGVLKRLVVIDCEEEQGDPIILVNPEILEVKGDPVTEDEGCLSCPGVVGMETRPYRVTVQTSRSVDELEENLMVKSVYDIR